MTFGKVALAILMYKTLELVWAFGFTVDADDTLERIVVLTLLWLIGWATAWKVTYQLKAIVLRDHPLKGAAE